MIEGLKQLIAPIDKQEFINQYLGQKPLYVASDKKATGLFSWQQASDRLTYCHATMEGFRLIYNKKGLPETELVNYKQWLQKGATLAINGLDKIQPSVYELANGLELDLNTIVNVNCYLSYPSVQAFDTHYDQHDVFALQLEGTKSWTVYDRPVEFPTHLLAKEQGGAPEGLVPLCEVRMTPGDVLYIPRGFWHHAVAETPSMHLTIGPSERTPIHFLKESCDRLLQNDAWLRRDFPVADALEFGGDREGLEDYFKQFSAHIIDHFSKEAFFESFIQYIQSANSYRRSDDLLTEYWDIDNIVNPETQFQFNPRQKCVLRYDEEQKFAIAIIRGKIVNLVGVSEQVLQLIFNKEIVFTGQDIMNHGDIGWGKAKTILTTMYRETICVLVRP